MEILKTAAFIRKKSYSESIQNHYMKNKILKYIFE